MSAWEMAVAKMQAKTPWNSSHKDEHGIYQDAVIVQNGVAIWAYHGNPIASFDGETWKKSTAGWDTATTRARLNEVPGRRIYRHKGKPYSGDEPWQDDELPVLYHRIDGWRGYSFPITAVMGASDTGNWSDSPCRPEKEIADFRAFLLEKGIPSSLAWTETSNLFCIKRWVQVRPINLEKALELAEGYLDGTATYLLHLPG